MKRENFDLSMTIGEGLFEEIKRSPADEITTSCGGCRLQILQGTGREAVSPVSLLARAYRTGRQPSEAIVSNYVEIQ